MNRKLLWGLVATGGASLVVSWLPGDEAAEIAEPAVARRAPPSMSATAAQVPAYARDVAVAPAPAPLDTETAATQPEGPPQAGVAEARRDWPALARPARSAWQPPPPPPAPPPPPPRPPAPPAPPPAFPYQWIGKLDKAGQVQFFLAGPQRTLAVKVGETVDQRWRVEGAEAGRLQVTWLGTGAVVQVSPP